MILFQQFKLFLQYEGTHTPNYPVKLQGKYSWLHIFVNNKYPPKMPNPANAGSLVYYKPFLILAKYLMWLKQDVIAVENFDNTLLPLIV